MSQPPIFAAVEHDLEHAWDALTAHLPQRHYHDPGTPATPATEAPAMSLATIVQAAEADARKIDDSAHNFISTHLPALRELAQSVEGSELFQVTLGLVGTLDPAAEKLAVTLLKTIAGQTAPAAAPAAPVDVADGQQAEPAQAG